jgi:hypothetical protein
MSNLDMLSGLPQEDVFVAPPLPLTRCPQPATLQASSIKPFSLFPHDTLHKQPWGATLVASMGALVVSPPAWWCS